MTDTKRLEGRVALITGLRTGLDVRLPNVLRPKVRM